MSISDKQSLSANTKRLLMAGVVAGPFFTLVWIVESLTRPDYNLLRHPVSSLELGSYGWMQSANFIVAALLTLAFALGLWLVLRSQGGSTWGPLLIALWAIGLLSAGIFITDPVSGYPPGTPAVTVNPTLHGALHDQISLVGFLGLTLACFVFASYFVRRGERGWAVYSVLTGILFPVGIFLASAAFAQTESLVAFGGLIQRLTVTLGWTWLTLLAIRLLKTIPEGWKTKADSFS